MSHTGQPLLYKLIALDRLVLCKVTNSYLLPCYFQLWSTQLNAPCNAEVITHHFAGHLGGEIILGTLWTEQAIRVQKVAQPLSDAQLCWAGAMPLAVKAVHELFEKGIPNQLFIQQHNTWVIHFMMNDSMFIIPLSELFRILFLTPSRRLSSFFLSRLPIELLCIPLRCHEINKLKIAHFCVASDKLSQTEAVLLASLLFDPALNKLFHFFQNDWLTRSDKAPLNMALPADLPTLPTFNFNLLFNASGRQIFHDGKSYFWVNSLELITYPYQFDRVIYCALRGPSALNEGTILPIECSNILKYGANNTWFTEYIPVSTSPLPERRKRVSKNLTRRNKIRRLRESNRLPFVEQGIDWAMMAINKNITWIDSEMILKVTKHTHISSRKKHLKHNYLDIIGLRYQQANCEVKYLTLNNTEEIFGENVSVHPINGYSPLPYQNYAKVIMRFHALEIQLNNGPFYLSQPFPEENPEMLMFCIKQNLVTPDLSEWNILLSHIIPVQDRYDFVRFRKLINHTTREQVSSNTAFLALPVHANSAYEFCLNIYDHVADKFVKRLQFYLAARLKYPDGMTSHEARHLSRISKNICDSPNPGWLAKLETDWWQWRSK